MNKIEKTQELVRNKRNFDELKTTNNRSVYNRAYKTEQEHEDLRCSVCPWHKGENATRRCRDYKCWKTNRKSQYRLR